MNLLLDEVCGYLHNYFVDEIHTGTFVIANKTLNVDFLKEGQYFRIIGSTFNDCVFQYPADDLMDESFSGSICAMAVPPSLIALLSEIEAWIAKYDGEDSTVKSPFTSESFNNYSYSKASGSSASGSYTPVTWRDIFASKLARWRKLP